MKLLAKWRSIIFSERMCLVVSTVLQDAGGNLVLRQYFPTIKSWFVAVQSLAFIDPATEKL